MSACEYDQSLLVPFPTVSLSLSLVIFTVIVVVHSRENELTSDQLVPAPVQSFIHTSGWGWSTAQTHARQLNCHDRLPFQFICMSKKHILFRMSSCLVKMLLLRRHRLIALANENSTQKSREKNNNQCASMSKHVSLIHSTLAAWWDRCAKGENTHLRQRLMSIFCWRFSRPLPIIIFLIVVVLLICQEPPVIVVIRLSDDKNNVDLHWCEFAKHPSILRCHFVLF